MATTMYELLMQLPVFQGISNEQLTTIIEKIPFSFNQYEPGEVIMNQGDDCSAMTFVLSGTVRTITPTFGHKVQIQQEFEGPYTLPFYNLFGAETHLHDMLIAVNKVGIMELDKSNFLRVLQHNPILLINVMNMLCTHAQKQHKAMDFSGESDPVLRLASWMLAFTERKAENIIVDAATEDWCDLLQVDETSYWRCVASLEGQHIVEVEGTRLKLIDRYGLRTFVGRKTAQNS